MTFRADKISYKSVKNEKWPQYNNNLIDLVSSDWLFISKAYNLNFIFTEKQYLQ